MFRKGNTGRARGARGKGRSSDHCYRRKCSTRKGMRERGCESRGEACSRLQIPSFPSHGGRSRVHALRRKETALASVLGRKGHDDAMVRIGPMVRYPMAAALR